MLENQIDGTIADVPIAWKAIDMDQWNREQHLGPDTRPFIYVCSLTGILPSPQNQIQQVDRGRFFLPH